MAIYIYFVTAPYAAPTNSTAILFFYSGLILKTAVTLSKGWGKIVLSMHFPPKGNGMPVGKNKLEMPTPLETAGNIRDCCSPIW